jgi:hypothetical protein
MAEATTLEPTTTTAATVPDTSTATPSTPETKTEPEINADTFKQAAMKRDVKSVREQFEKLRGRRDEKKTELKSDTAVASPNQPAAAKPDAKPDTTTAGATKPEQSKGKYVVGDGDARIELDDPDGFFKYGGVEELKKAFAHKERRIQMDKKWMQDAEQSKMAERQRADTVAAENATLKAELEKLKATPASAPAKQDIVKPELQLTETPQPPVIPNLPDDVSQWENEHVEASKKYQRDRADYESKLVKWVEESTRKTAKHAEELAKSGVPVDTNNPLVKDMVEMKRVISELQQLNTDIKKSKDQLETERRQSEYWTSIDDFQKLHPEMATPLPMKDLHKQIWEDGTNLTWMDYVSLANGTARPATTDQNAWNQYFQNRLAVTQKFINGDKDVIAKCEAAGVEPPTGYREYFESAKRIRDIDDEHNRLKQQGLLGPNSTRQMAWEYANKSRLTDQIRMLEQKAHSEGASTVINALTKHDTEHAVVVPPDLAASGSTPLSREKVLELLKQTPERSRDSEFKKMLAELTKK